MLKNRFTAISIVAVVVFYMSACTQDSNIGLNLLPENSQIDHLITDTVTLKSYTQNMDTIAGSRVSKLLIGKLADPIFGITEAATAVQVSLGSFRNFSDTIMADSVYLHLAYNNTDLRAYGDSTVNQTVNVYRMRENLQYDSIYYADTDPNSLHENELMGTTQFRTADNLDSLLRIRLDDSWADFFMHAEDSSVYDYGEDFRRYFNGFVISADESSPEASVVSLTLNTYSRLKVYYHTPTDPDSAREANFPINDFCARLNMFKHDYNGSPIEPVINSEEQHSHTYIQGMNGLIMQISIPYIDKMQENGNIAVYNAELLVETSDETVSLENIYPPVPQMIITAIDNEGNYSALTEYSSDTGYKSIKINDSGQYRFNISSYIQNILQGNRDNNGLYIYPASSSQNFYRSVVNSPENENPMKLIITYSVL